MIGEVSRFRMLEFVREDGTQGALIEDGCPVDSVYYVPHARPFMMSDAEDNVRTAINCSKSGPNSEVGFLRITGSRRPEITIDLYPQNAAAQVDPPDSNGG